MKILAIRPSKFSSFMMVFGGATLLYAASNVPELFDGFANAFLLVFKLNVIVVMIYGLVNLIWPRGLASEQIDIVDNGKQHSPVTESFAALQHLYEKGLLTHEEYRHKVDSLTRLNTTKREKNKS